MASQQTPNYKLSRWAGTDRIMMEDFNRDNAAIDAALKGNAEAVAAETAAREAADTALGKKAGLQLIQTLTLATGSDYASAEINIDWSQWAEVYVVFQLEYKGSMKSYNLYFLPNDDYLVRTTMAAAQLKHITPEAAHSRIQTAIDQYREAQKKSGLESESEQKKKDKQ